MITIDEAREILHKARGQAKHVFSDEDAAAQQAIDYLFVVVDTELLHRQKVEQRNAGDVVGCNDSHSD